MLSTNKLEISSRVGHRFFSIKIDTNNIINNQYTCFIGNFTNFNETTPSV